MKCKKFLILAYPRSATLYTSIYFEGIGLHVAHEIDEAHVLRAHGVTTHYDGLVTGVFKNCTFDPGQYDVILHQTRDPIKVISSAHKAGGNLSTQIIKKFGDKIYPPDALARQMKAWLTFTDMADRLSAYTFRVENIGHEFLHICHNLLGLTGVKKGRGMMPKCNQSKHREWTYEELSDIDPDLTERVKAKARNYGYTIQESTQ